MPFFLAIGGTSMSLSLAKQFAKGGGFPKNQQSTQNQIVGYKMTNGFLLSFELM